MAGPQAILKLQPRFLWVSAVVLIVAAGFYWILIRNRNPDRFLQASKPDVTASGGFDTNAFPNSLPKQGGPPGYVTSAACKECHPKQFESWWRSYHRPMTQVMGTNTVQAKFDGVMMNSGGARFTLHQASNRYWVDIQGIEELQAAQLTNGPPPIPNRIPMEMVTGSHYFQVFW